MNIKAIATDKAGVTVSDVFTLAVENINDAPIVNNLIPSQRTENGQAFSYTLPNNIFSDPDGDTLTFSPHSAPQTVTDQKSP